MKGKKYKILLIDLDNTLLDFDKAEDLALTKTLVKYGLSPDEKTKNRFKTINKYYWNEFEKGNISKENLLKRRFSDFFSQYDKHPNESEVNSFYLYELSNSSDVMPNAYECLEYLNDKVYICAISNGVYNTQMRRLEKSNIIKYLKKIYISEKIGYQKPSKEFFDYVFDDLKIERKEEVLVVGDSLSADISGGVSYGIDTCFFDYSNCYVDNMNSYSFTYKITNIIELKNIIK